MRSVRSRICSAATAITIAPPAGIFDSRVSMLPRSSTNSEVGAHLGQLGPATHRAAGHRGAVRRARRDGHRPGRRRVAARAERHRSSTRRRASREGPWPSAPRCRRCRRARPAAPPSRTRPDRRSCAAARPSALIARRLDQHELDRRAGGRARSPRDGRGLRHRLPRTSGREPDWSGRSSAAQPRSKRSRIVTALRSPCGDPACAFRRTDGSCSSLATIAPGQRLDRFPLRRRRGRRARSRTDRARGPG